jgi:hypothetical protein
METDGTLPYSQKPPPVPIPKQINPVTLETISLKSILILPYLCIGLLDNIFLSFLSAKILYMLK